MNVLQENNFKDFLEILKLHIFNKILEAIVLEKLYKQIKSKWQYDVLITCMQMFEIQSQ